MAIGSLSAEKRHAVLTDLLEKSGSLDLAEAAEACGVSEMTIRRDLQQLESRGLVKRVRGGAVSVEPERFERRVAMNRSAKIKIASKLAALIPARGMIGMDSSTTLHAFALRSDALDVEVFTTGIENFLAMRGKAKRVVLSGGELEEATDNLVGPVALKALEDFYFARSFISISALHPEFGATDSTIETAAFKRALRARSGEIVLATDSSKFMTTTANLSLPLSEIDVLVTELDPDDTLLDPFRDHVEIL
ncbi:transcriptional regulator, DeoR family [Bowdeniella nasicola]|uniref:Transcriptional regulator, DeoR family n=1 Tax=Bowdeniella nasicola TaxID=208480 RepID=A0A1H4B784_9ACTO|nr:DeoR/GlpR family DNA-binding transcription regulator [Bowdeniella nasicola]SEA43692.1 transcriptional regulator, DeoR family [Bowdeniella nasicola]